MKARNRAHDDRAALAWMIAHLERSEILPPLASLQSSAVRAEHLPSVTTAEELERRVVAWVGRPAEGSA